MLPPLNSRRSSTARLSRGQQRATLPSELPANPDRRSGSGEMQAARHESVLARDVGRARPVITVGDLQHSLAA
jgi:hypothetical protein